MLNCSAAGSPTLEQNAWNRTVQFVGEPSTEFSEFGGVPPANIGALKKQIRYGMANPPMRVTRGMLSFILSFSICYLIVVFDPLEHGLLSNSSLSCSDAPSVGQLLCCFMCSSSVIWQVKVLVSCCVVKWKWQFPYICKTWEFSAMIIDNIVRSGK